MTSENNRRSPAPSGRRGNNIYQKLEDARARRAELMALKPSANDPVPVAKPESKVTPSVELKAEPDVKPDVKPNGLPRNVTTPQQQLEQALKARAEVLRKANQETKADAPPEAKPRFLTRIMHTADAMQAASANARRKSVWFFINNFVSASVSTWRTFYWPKKADNTPVVQRHTANRSEHDT